MIDQEYTYVMSEHAFYDMAASACFIGLSLMSEGVAPRSREECIEILRRSMPPWAVEGSIKFSELGRPEDQRLDFMQEAADNARAHGDLEMAAGLQEAVNEERAAGA